VHDVQRGALPGGVGDEQEVLVHLASRGLRIRKGSEAQTEAVHEAVEVLKRSRSSGNEELATSLLRASEARHLFERARGSGHSHDSDANGSSSSRAATAPSDEPVDDSVPWQNRRHSSGSVDSPTPFDRECRLDPLGSPGARRVIPVDSHDASARQPQSDGWAHVPGAALYISDMGHVGL